MSRPGSLAGVRVAVTRPADRAGALTAALEAAGATTLCFPLIRIVGPADPAPLDAAARRLRSYDWVVFTSASGVAALLGALGRPALPAVPPPRYGAVGPATAAAIEAAGGAAAVVADEHVGEALAGALAGAGPLQGARVLWPRAAGARRGLLEALEASGARVEAPEAYAVVPDEVGAAHLVSAVAAGAIDVLTFTSPSAVRSFSEAGGVVPGGMRVAAIGPVTAAAAERAGLPVHVRPTESTAVVLAGAIVEAFEERS